MARNHNQMGSARYHNIQESEVNGLWVGKGDNLGRFRSLLEGEFMARVCPLSTRLAPLPRINATVLPSPACQYLTSSICSRPNTEDHHMTHQLYP